MLGRCPTSSRAGSVQQLRPPREFLARNPAHDVDLPTLDGHLLDHGLLELDRAPLRRLGCFELHGGDQVAVDVLLPLDQQGDVQLGLPLSEPGEREAAERPDDDRDAHHQQQQSLERRGGRAEHHVDHEPIEQEQTAEDPKDRHGQRAVGGLQAGEPASPSDLSQALVQFGQSGHDRFTHLRRNHSANNSPTSAAKHAQVFQSVRTSMVLSRFGVSSISSASRATLARS